MTNCSVYLDQVPLADIAFSRFWRTPCSHSRVICDSSIQPKTKAYASLVSDALMACLQSFTRFILPEPNMQKGVGDIW